MIWQTSGPPTQPQAGCMPTRWKHTMLGGLQKGLGRTMTSPPQQKYSHLHRLYPLLKPPQVKPRARHQLKHLLRQLTEKINQYCNILNLPGSKNNNNRTATMAAYAKSQWGLDLAEVNFSPQIKTIKKIFLLQNSFITLP